MQFSPNKIYILDGAMGTELQRRGLRTDLPPWSAHALFHDTDIIKDIHRQYIASGADIITTNTFRTQKRSLAKGGHDDEVETINRLAVDLAVRAREEAGAGRPIFIAGSITTLEDCYAPDLVPDDATCRREHREQVKILADTPIDFFLLETFNTVREAAIAAEAVHETTKPFAVSFATTFEGNLLGGESLEDAIKALDEFSPIAYLVNCQAPMSATNSLAALRTLTSLPVGVYANGEGQAAIDVGWQFSRGTTIIEYAEAAQQWKKMGAVIIGGCCGTSPEYTKAYAKLK